ncbi:hypothetical protein BH11GEM2_BH11GEM2_34600 [soil metagenome]|jgi:hypothetical protein
MRAGTLILTSLTPLIVGCAAPQPGAAAPVIEALTCGDSTAAYARYGRAGKPSLADTASAVVVTVVKGAPPHGVRVNDIQLWGPRSAHGGPGDSSGTTIFPDRDPGLHSLQIRVTSDRRWIYAATLRPGYVDTVIVDLDRRCTTVWRGGQ